MSDKRKTDYKMHCNKCSHPVNKNFYRCKVFVYLMEKGKTPQDCIFNEEQENN